MKKMCSYIAGLSVLFLALPGMASAEMLFTANLSGLNEVPPNASTKSGTATFVLNDAETQLSYAVEIFGFDFAGIYTATTSDDLSGLHIHNAPAGSNGSVVFGIFSPAQDKDVVLNITPSSIQFTGVWDSGDASNMSLASQLNNLKNGNLYLNVHTTGIPAGEIRGQLEAVPEPGSAALACIAIGGLLVWRRRKGARRSLGML